MAVESNPPQPLKAPNTIISFSDLDFKETGQNLHDLVVISMVAKSYIIRKMLVNEGTLPTSYMILPCRKRKYLNPVLAHTTKMWNFL